MKSICGKSLTWFEECSRRVVEHLNSVHKNLVCPTLKMHSVSLHDDCSCISHFIMQTVDNLLDDNTRAVQSCEVMCDFSAVTYFPIGYISGSILHDFAG